MLELSLLESTTMVLRVVAWANVSVAVALLLAVTAWLVCCGLESRSHSEMGKQY